MSAFGAMGDGAGTTGTSTGLAKVVTLPRGRRGAELIMLAFAIGVMPLALAVGAGANARHSIGTGIIGGMIGETTLAMLYVPLFFYLFDRLAERRKGEGAVAPEPPSSPANPPGAAPAAHEGD